MISEHFDHTPRWRRATYLGTLHRSAGSSRRSDAEGAVQHYYAVLEPAGTGGFRIRFPDRPSITSAAMSVRDIVAQAQHALALMLRHPAADLPRSIEGGARPPADLSDYEDPLVVVIPFERVPAAASSEPMAEPPGCRGGH
jgi:predicted RNase H-like HicB family nuclease